MDSVGVVVPVRDAAGVLPRCLRALEQQTRAPDEIVVVDNGSTDRTRTIAERLGARVLTEPRHGVPAAAARGYDAVTSDLILRVDADTVAPNDWIERMTARFDREPGLDAVSGSAAFVGLPGPAARALGRLYLGMYYDAFGRMLGMPVLYGSNLAMRRSAWLDVSSRVHREDAVMHDDLDLAIHLGLAGRRVVVDRTIRVAVAAEPLRHPIGLLRRATRAAYTVARHPELHLALPLRSIDPADHPRGAEAPG